MRSLIALTLMMSVPFQCLAQERPEDLISRDEPAGVMVRIIRDDPDPEMVRWLAFNATSRRLISEAAQPSQASSGNDIARRLCGSVQPGYWSAFLELNGLDRQKPLLAATAPLGERAYQYDWPTCFWYEKGPFTHILGLAETLADLYLAETGSTGQPDTRNHFARFTNLPDPDKAPPGTTIRYAFRSRPVLFNPTSLSHADFTRDLRSMAAKFFGTSANALTPPATLPSIDGRIVMGDNGSTQSDFDPPECRGVTVPPFDLARIRGAFTAAKAYRADAVDVAILDNGFFGATRDEDQLLFRGLFHSTQFRTNTGSDGNARPQIGPVLALSPEQPLYPLNFDNGFPADSVPDRNSGHGTHVAGLALGGPARDDEVLFNRGLDQWLRLSIVTLAPGTSEMRPAAASQLSSALRDLNFGIAKPSIINLSAAFGRNAAAPLSKFVDGNRDVLFVVAAGNQYSNLDNGYLITQPAMMGNRDNVLAVAAEDGTGNLTYFTNQGQSVVALAAPGCNLDSTLDGNSPTKMSGTSQAAPVVSFAAALLLKINLPQSSLKRRLVLSGDLLTGQIRKNKATNSLERYSAPIDQPFGISSRSRLNIAKALYKDFDYIAIRETKNGVTSRLEYLGEIGGRSGPGCGDPNALFDAVFAFKRVRADPPQSNAASVAICFWKNQLKPATLADDGGGQLSFLATKQILADGQIKSVARSINDIPLEQIDEFVLSEATMQALE